MGLLEREIVEEAKEHQKDSAAKFWGFPIVISILFGLHLGVIFKAGPGPQVQKWVGVSGLP